ncbi:hypothetical protein IFR05_012058 [Cadophora sp. M221]|nr:hypothetical protein IFR05_012058 [Cadophora sp. M221]
MTHKRESEGDANPNPSKYRTRDRGNQWVSTNATFERFLAAYRGEHGDALGGDFPPTTLFVQEECAVFISTSGDSRILSTPQESTTYIYDTSSQNAAIEIRMWVADQRHSERYNLVRSVVLNSEVMAAPLVRISIPNSSSLAVRGSSERVIPRVSTVFKAMSAALRPWQDSQYGVECLIIKLKKSKLWIRERPGLGNEISKICQDLKEDIDDLEYVTILRTSEHEDLHFVDEVWEYQHERCRKDEIYWGYNINRTIPKLPNGKGDLPFTHQVLRGMLAAPQLPWLKRPGSPPDDWLSHPFKASFTSIEEWEAVFTIALLQDVEWNRTSASNAYSSVGNHPKRVVEDEKDPSHFWLHITAATPLPRVTAGIVFKLNNASNTDAESAMQQLEARAVDIEGCNDLVLELRVRGKKKARPWGDETGIDKIWLGIVDGVQVSIFSGNGDEVDNFMLLNAHTALQTVIKDRNKDLQAVWAKKVNHIQNTKPVKRLLVRNQSLSSEAEALMWVKGLHAAKDAYGVAMALSIDEFLATVNEFQNPKNLFDHSGSTMPLGYVVAQSAAFQGSQLKIMRNKHSNSFQC